MMAEEYAILNPDVATEGGGEIPPETLADIKIIADNIEDINDVAAWLRGDSGGGIIVIPSVDGNDTKIQIRRNTGANWEAADPVLNIGEFGFVTDSALPILKIGDGVTAFSGLKQLNDQVDFTYDQILAALADAQASATAAAASAAAASASSDTAATSAAAALVSEQDAQNWAIAPDGILPGGESSAKVSAGLAANIAMTSRTADIRDGITADEIVPSGALYKLTPVSGGADITVTLPAGLYSSAEKKEAWLRYALRATAGTVKFVSRLSTGGTIETPATVGGGRMIFLRTATFGNVQKAGSVSVTLTAVTTGKIIVTTIVTFQTVPSAPPVYTATMDGGVTLNVISVLAPTVTATLRQHTIIWEGTLTALAAGTYNVTVSIGPWTYIHSTCCRVMTGIGTLPTMFVVGSFGELATISLTIPALPKNWTVIAFCAKRAIPTTSVFSSFSSNMFLGASGTTTNPAAPESDPASSFGNHAWARGNGVATLDGNNDFTVTANWTNATGRCAMTLVAYPPLVTTGPPTPEVEMHFQGTPARDTITEPYGEATIFIDNTGARAFIQIPKP